jgi:hypothetical protein
MQIWEVLDSGLSRMFGFRLPDRVLLLCLLVRAQHTMVFWVCMVTPYLNPYLCSWIELPLYTRIRLILTFVVMSRWTTLAPRRLMWNYGLS